MNYQEKAKDIYDMLAVGKLMEAFEKYYAENVTMEDVGDNNKRVGKAACRDWEKKFLESVEAVHGMQVVSITSDEHAKTSMVESSMDVTMKGMGRINMVQVAVQHWEGDHIVVEKFYHK